jgi:hypothetical protein
MQEVKQRLTAAGFSLAARTRRGMVGALAWLRGSAEQVGLRTGPVGTWVLAHKRALQLGATALAAVALVFWDRPR